MSKSAGLHFGSSDRKPETAPEKVTVRPEFESFTQLLAQKILERSSIAPETQKIKSSGISESENTQISAEVARSVAQKRRKF